MNNNSALRLVLISAVGSLLAVFVFVQVPALRKIIAGEE